MGYELEPMLEMFIYETHQMLDNIEKTVIDVEDTGSYSKEAINEIFRGMHTIKGSSGMMMFDSMSTLSHALEDLYDLLRSNDSLDYSMQTITDLTLETVDFLKEEMEQVEEKHTTEGDPSAVIHKIKNYIRTLKGEPKKRGRSKKVEAPKVTNYYIASEDNTDSGNIYAITVKFTEECVMENVRAYTLMNALHGFSVHIESYPDNLLEEDESIVEYIRKNGFYMKATTNEGPESFNNYIDGYPYVASFEVKPYLESEEPQGFSDTNSKASETDEVVIHLDEDEGFSETLFDNQIEETIEIEQSKERSSKVIDKNANTVTNVKESEDKKSTSGAKTAKMISVNVEKLDKLMDLVGELVVSEAMVTRSQSIEEVMDDTLEKNIRQHRKIINDMQDVAMAIRMVPLSATFQKMKRIVRDISKNTNKEIELKLIGEHTEADKNIIERISDPLMHLIRNACDHGIETPEERERTGKIGKGTVTLEAKNSGGDIWIIVRDDGRGLDSDKIYEKAIEKGMIDQEAKRPTDEELYKYIYMPGFSTKEQVSQFSGRGVGMDVVVSNIEQIGGSINVKSEKGQGSTILIKIPLTLTIIDGMRLSVGKSEFILPITSIKESFKIDKEDYIKDPNGNEMMLVRGETLSLVKLYDHYNVPAGIEDIYEGIIIMVGDEEQMICIFADKIIGEQQVVVKPLPKYMKRIEGISGCAILGDGGISLILDVDGLIRIV